MASLPPHSSVKVVEVPPGPPVLSTLLAEVYGPDPATRRTLAAQLRKVFESVGYIVDVDDSFGVPAERQRLAIDQEALEFHGVSEQAVYDTIGAIVGGTNVGYSQRGSGLKPIAISVALPRSGLTLGERILSTPLPAGGTVRQGANVELGDVVKLTTETASFPIYRHNGRFAEMVSAEMAGATRPRSTGCSRSTRRSPIWTGARRSDQRSRSTGNRSTSSNRLFCGTASSDPSNFHL